MICICTYSGISWVGLCQGNHTPKTIHLLPYRYIKARSPFTWRHYCMVLRVYLHIKPTTIAYIYRSQVPPEKIYYWKYRNHFRRRKNNFVSERTGKGEVKDTILVR
ncbi:hypothetical protein BDW72DRAFT_18457 [Aspergillus terricola var. indicus]